MRHKAHIITYYKIRDDRAEDYRKVILKLQLFQGQDDESQKLKLEISNAVENLPKERLVEVLEASKGLLKR